VATPTVSRAPRAFPDHWEEHVRLAQWVDVDKPQGITAYKTGSATAVALSSTPYAAFTLTNVPIKANRFYLIVYVQRAYQTGANAGTCIMHLTANGVNITDVHCHLGANQFYMNLSWHHAYILTADTTVTFVANVNGPAGSSGWFDRGGQLRVEDKGKDRGKN
jgi:hypothetical protein